MSLLEQPSRLFLGDPPASSWAALLSSPPASSWAILLPLPGRSSCLFLPSAHCGGHGQFVAEVDVWVNWWQTCPWVHQVASGSRVWLGRLALRTRVRHASNTCGMRASRPGQTLESDARLPGYPPHARAPRQQHMRDEGQPTRADCGVGCSATRLPSAHRGGHGQFVAEGDVWVDWWQTCPWLRRRRESERTPGSGPTEARLRVRTPSGGPTEAR